MKIRTKVAAAGAAVGIVALGWVIIRQLFMKLDSVNIEDVKRDAARWEPN